MPYAPTVNDRSGELLAMGQIGAANTKLQGMQMLSQGISQAGSSLAGGIASAMTGMAEKGAVASEALGQAEAIRSVGQQYNLDTSMLDALLANEKDPYKLKGYLDVFGQHLGQTMQNQYQQRNFEMSRDLAGYKASLGGGAAARPVPPTQRPWTGIELAPGLEIRL
jgi:hypothetical protein